jgi:hypothetical protein
MGYAALKRRSSTVPRAVVALRAFTVLRAVGMDYGLVVAYGRGDCLSG